MPRSFSIFISSPVPSGLLPLLIAVIRLPKAIRPWLPLPRRGSYLKYRPFRFAYRLTRRRNYGLFIAKSRTFESDFQAQILLSNQLIVISCEIGMENGTYR